MIRTGAVPVMAEEDGPVPDPALIQEQIEQTRAELAETIDAIAQRVSPKNVARRGAETVKAKVEDLRSQNGAHGQPGPAGLGPDRHIRWDRVGIAGGVVVLLALLIKRRRSS